MYKLLTNFSFYSWFQVRHIDDGMTPALLQALDAIDEPLTKLFDS